MPSKPPAPPRPPRPVPSDVSRRVDPVDRVFGYLMLALFVVLIASMTIAIYVAVREVNEASEARTQLPSICDCSCGNSRGAP
jgi:hypothetical protein